MLLTAPTGIHAQILRPDGPPPSFEVATIKPVEGAPPPSSGPPSLPHDEIRVIETTKLLIASAYYLQASSPSEIIGGSAWTDNQMFDIKAKINGPLSEAMQQMSSNERKQKIQLMDQSLLADRFKLKVHFETRELPQYALVVAKGGVKLKPADPAEPHQRSAMVPKGQGAELTAAGTTTEDLASMLQFQPELGGRITVDQTGLTGRYDITLDWTPARVNATAPNSQDAGLSLFTALQEQLGLRLVETKGPVEVVVIDHIEKPSEN